MTTQDLLTLDHEINQMNSAHKRFNRGKIKDFYNKYLGIIDISKQRVNLLQDEFFVFEDKKIKFEGEGKDMKPVFKEGKTMEDYNEKYNSIMRIQVLD